MFPENAQPAFMSTKELFSFLYIFFLHLSIELLHKCYKLLLDNQFFCQIGTKIKSVQIKILHSTEHSNWVLVFPQKRLEGLKLSNDATK